MTALTIPALLAGLLAAESSRPLVTFYDDASGERTELSVRSFDNWVAKTANLLQHELGATAGERLAIALPTHWQGMVWLCAAWSCGLVVLLDQPGTVGGDYTVAGPDRVATDAATVALSLEPFGAGFRGPLPSGTLDYAVEVVSQPDVFIPEQPVGPELPALQSADGTRTQADLVSSGAEVAAALQLGAAARLLTDANPCTVAGLGAALLAPLACAGSVVLVRNPDAARETARIEQERVTARVTSAGQRP